MIELKTIVTVACSKSDKLTDGIHKHYICLCKEYEGIRREQHCLVAGRCPQTKTNARSDENNMKELNLLFASTGRASIIGDCTVFLSSNWEESRELLLCSSALSKVGLGMG